MDRKEILELLDRLDKFRRAHQDDRQHPSDWCMRMMEAIVAQAGGYQSRNGWMAALKADDTTAYSNDMENGMLF